MNGTGLVIISGTITKTSAGTSTISGIQLQTNSAALLAVTGSAASIVNLNNCYLNCTNNTGITFSSSSSSSKVNIFNCTGNIGTTGISLYTMSSTGVMQLDNSLFTNTGASTTASTNSAGQVNINNLAANLSFSTSSTGIVTFNNSDVDNTATNTTTLTTAGTGSAIFENSYIASGTASSVSVGVGTTVSLLNSVHASSNTNNITGAATLIYSGLSLFSSQTINVTSQSGGLLPGGRFQAPSAGFIGEQIRSAIASGSPVTLTTATPTNITSISLTAGIWDISGIGIITNSGATTLHQLSVNTTSATIGTLGDNACYDNTLNNFCTLSIPAWRQTFTTTTPVYLVAQDTFSTGAGAAYGRISATRVG